MIKIGVLSPVSTAGLESMELRRDGQDTLYRHTKEIKNHLVKYYGKKSLDHVNLIGGLLYDP